MLRRKWIVVVAVVMMLTVGVELAVRTWNGTKACVQVINEGDAPIEDLVVSYSTTRVELGALGRGLSAKAWFSDAGRRPLTLEFKQQDNALKGFKIADFDPGENSRNGSKLVLIVKSNRVDRFMEEDEASMSVQKLSDRIKDWLRPRF
jgi:hypothetical protein